MSSWLVPYSSEYSTLMRAAGSLPGLRTGTNGSPSAAAIGAPKMKPRDSMPTMASRRSARATAASDRRSVAERGWLLQERRDVAEEDARLREVGDVADVVLEVHCLWISAGLNAGGARRRLEYHAGCLTPPNLKKRATADIDGRKQQLIDFSLDIHKHPEIAFEEHRSAGELCVPAEQRLHS